ncbi:MAG: PAS domain S-box protein [Chloroflexi bacterium]|nr:PAS domain S-box protein [Chloroflexota bacterium]
MAGKSRVARKIPGLASAEVLKESEEWHRALVETVGKAGYGIVILQNTLEREAAIVFVNDEACKMVGYSPAEALAMSAWDFLASSELAKLQERYRQRQSGEQALSYYDTTILRKDGTSLPIEASASTMIYHGNIATVLFFEDITERRGMQQELDEYRRHLEKLVAERTAELRETNEQLQHEITERKQIELVLRESEKYFRSLIENSQEVIVVLDSDGTIRYQSPSAQHVTKYSPRLRQGKSIFEFIHPDDLPRLARLFEEMKASPGATIHSEWRGLWNDGLWHYVEGSARNLLHDPAVAGIVANFRDITERQLALENLKKSEKYFRSLTENALDAVVVITRDGTIKSAIPLVNPPRGYQPEEVIGTNSFLEVHPEDISEAINAYNELMHNPGISKRTEMRVRHKDGSWRNVEVIGSNLLDDPIVAGIIVNYRDVTEHRKAAEKLQELYRQERDLRQQLETEMKRRVEFTRALAHELKTPLTPMLISSQVLASELKEEPLLSLARNISRGASNLNSRIDELLDLAKGEIGMLQLKIEPLDALQLLREVVEYVAPVALSRGQSLIVELPDSLPLVRADKVRLRQIVLNLLNNALNYTPEGGRITLRAGQKDANLIVEVEDNGPGIAEEEQQHMFEPYHRMEVAGERLSGLGLGLTLCKTLVDLHSGQIWVKSCVGKGSTFSFSLPLEAANK